MSEIYSGESTDLVSYGKFIAVSTVNYYYCMKISQCLKTALMGHL